MVNWWPIVIKHLPFCIHYHFKSFNCDEFIALIRTIDSSGAEGVILIPSKFATRSFVCAKYCLFLNSRRKNVFFLKLQTNSWKNTFWLYKHFVKFDISSYFWNLPIWKLLPNFEQKVLFFVRSAPKKPAIFGAFLPDFPVIFSKKLTLNLQSFRVFD